MTFEPSSSPTTNAVRIEREPRAVVVKRHDAVIASSQAALIVHGILEAPVYYVPEGDVYTEHLTPSDGAGSEAGKNVGEANGRRFLSVVASGGGVADAAWTHEGLTGDVQALAGHIGFDPAIFNVTAG